MKEALTAALHLLRGREELALLRVVPACGENVLGQAQGNGRPAVAEDIADVLLARPSEGEDIRLALCLDCSQFIIGRHSPEPDLVVSDKVEQVSATTEDFGRWRARWPTIVERSARASPEGEIEEIRMPARGEVGPHYLAGEVDIIRAGVGVQEVLIVGDRLADTKSEQGFMMIVDIGIGRIQASAAPMLDDDVIVTDARVEGTGLLTGGDEPVGVRWVIVDVVNEMCDPPF